MSVTTEEDIPLEHTVGPRLECPACIADREAFGFFPTVRVSRTNKDTVTEDFPDEDF